MGMFLVFQKTRESETTVEYQYGHSLTNLDKSLVIDKAHPTGPQKDGPRNAMAQRVVGLVMSRRTDLDPWPESGALQS